MINLKRFFKTTYEIFPIFNRPMAACALFSILGILILYKNQSVALSLLILFSLFAAAFCLITKSKKIFVVSILFLAVCASAVNEFQTVKDLETLNNKVVNADFVALEDSYNTGKVTKVSVYCRNSDVIPKNSKFSLYYFLDEELNCGDTFTATVKLKSLEDNQYKMYNFGNMIYMDCRLLKITNRYSPNKFFEKIGNIRRYMINTISDNFSDDISSVLIALNCGDRRYLSKEFYSKVLVCGVAHIMVVSGLHISIIIGFIFKFFEKVYYNRYLKSIISIIMIFMICAVCGFTLSVIRAGIMFIFFVLAPVFKRSNDGMNSLGAAVILILFFSPFSVYSVSFLLSVTATLSVVWIAPFYSDIIIEKLHIENKFIKGIVVTLCVSVSAMIFTAPITIAVFGTFAILAPIAFLLITFPVTYALEFNTLAVALSSIKGIALLSKPLFIISGACAWYIKMIIDNLGILDFLLIDADLTEFLIFVFLIFALIMGMCLYNFYKRLMKKTLLAEVKAYGHCL